MAKLQAVLQCCLLRRTKKSRIDGGDEPIVRLPEKTITHDKPEFSPQERTVYNALEERNIKIFNRMLDQMEKHFRNIFVMITRMRQMCLHHYLVTDGKDLDVEGLVTDKVEIEDLIEKMPVDPKRRLRESIENETLEDCPICIEGYYF
jgi:SNF2 family DNA or RNA helicase